MRGADVLHESIFVVKTLNNFVPTKYLLRRIREGVNGALKVRASVLSCSDDETAVSPTHANWPATACAVGPIAQSRLAA